MGSAQRVAPQASWSEVRANLKEPTDVLARLDWADSEEDARAAGEKLLENARKEDSILHDSKDQERALQGKLSEFDGETRLLRVRIEQLERRRDENNRSFKTQIEASNKIAMAEEDAVPTVKRQFEAKHNGMDQCTLRSRL